MKIVPTVAFSPRIALVDDFEKITTDVDGDGNPCISHGESMESLIKAFLPDADIRRFNIGKNPFGVVSGLTSEVERLLELIKQGEEFDGVNISRSSHLAGLFSSLGLGKGVTRDNIHEFRAKLLEQCCMDERFIDKMIEEMVFSHNVPVFISAGNGGPEYINQLALASGARIIGATHTDGQVCGLSPQHSLIHEYHRGIFNIYRTQNGFSIGGSSYNFKRLTKINETPVFGVIRIA